MPCTKELPQKNVSRKQRWRGRRGGEEKTFGEEKHSQSGGPHRESETERDLLPASSAICMPQDSAENRSLLPGPQLLGVRARPGGYRESFCMENAAQNAV